MSASCISLSYKRAAVWTLQVDSGKDEQVKTQFIAAHIFEQTRQEFCYLAFEEYFFFIKVESVVFKDCLKLKSLYPLYAAEA